MLAALLICGVPFNGAVRGSEFPLDDGAEPGLEELGQIQVDSIYTASKYEQKVTKAASSASIITREEIQRFGHRNLTDILRSVRGMSVSSDRNYSYLGMRGFLRPGDYTTRVLVLINGHRMNDNLYDSGYISADSFLDVDMIERVEVVRGPGSAVYGNNAFFGVINIVTRGADKIDGAEVSAEAGSFDTYKGRFTYGARFKNDVRLTLSGTVLTSDGDDYLYYREFDDTAEHSDEERARYLFGSISWKGFTLEGNYFDREKNIPTASFSTIFNDGREWTRDEQTYLELRYETPVEAETGVFAKIAYDWYEYRGIYPYDYDIGVPVLFKDFGDGEWLTPELNVHRTFWDRWTLSAGADARFNIQQRQVSYDEEPRGEVVDLENLRNNYGVYGQSDLAVTDSLNLVTGLRYDYFEEVGGSVNPRAGLIYSPLKNTTLKLLYGEAFRAPNMYELTVNQSETGNGPALRPEKIRTYEVVVDQYFLKNFRAGASLYRFEIDDIISQEPAPETLDGFRYANFPGAVGHGVEVELEGRFDHGVLARASYAVQRAEDRDGARLSSSPAHAVKAGLILPVWHEKIFSGIEFQYTSSALTLAGNRADDYLLVNWTLYARELLPGLDLSFGVYNLLDDRYGDIGGEDLVQDVIPQDGRTFRAKVTYRF